MMIILMTKNVHTAIALNADGLTMRLIMNINTALNAAGMPIKKLGVKQENPNRQITKWEMQTFSRGVGSKMFANSFICVTNEYSYRLLNIRKRLKSNNKINFKRLKTDK